MQSQRRLKNSIVLTLILLASISALAAAADTKRVVNINTADAKQLSNLPRIGLAVAQRIVDYRKENGPFKTTDELMLVRGIGEKLFAQLKPYVVTSGETTLDEKVAGAGRSGKGSKTKGSKAKPPKGAGKSGPKPKASAQPSAKAGAEPAASTGRASRQLAAPASAKRAAGGAR